MTNGPYCRRTIIRLATKTFAETRYRRSQITYSSTFGSDELSVIEPVAHKTAAHFALARSPAGVMNGPLFNISLSLDNSIG